jgi:capsular polysaccharide biosynthesis protein
VIKALNSTPFAGLVRRLARALAPDGRRRLPEVDLGRADRWGSPDAAVAVEEVAPAIRVERGAAVVDVVRQPGARADCFDETPSYVAPAGQLVRVRGGSVETGMVIAFSARRGYFSNTVRKSAAMLERRGYRVSRDDSALVFPRRPKRFVERRVVLLALPFRDNYFHWLIEGLGRLLPIRNLLPPDVAVAVRNGSSARFIGELLALTDVDYPIYELPPRHSVTFRELYVPPALVRSSARSAPRDRSVDFQLHPAAVDAVRALRPAPPRAATRLYVERSSRKPANDGEVAETLARYDFETIRSEQLTVREQMKRFAAADVVVGAHGAGLANIVFSPTGTTVIELASDRVTPGARNLYWNLSAICGLRWVGVACPALQPTEKSDFHVDCRHLEETLERHLQAPHDQGARSSAD